MHDLDGLDAFIPVDRDGRDTEPESDGFRLAARLARRESSQDLHVALHHVRGGLELRFARRIEVELPRLDEDVRAGKVPELAELGRRPRRLHRATPSEDDDLTDPGPHDRGDGSIRRVGGRELLGGQRQHAGDVERDVPVPDHDRPLVREIERELLMIGVAVVPGDELGSGPRAGKVLARDAQPSVGL